MKHADLYPTEIQKEVIDVFYQAGYGKPVYKDDFVAEMSKLIAPGTRSFVRIDKNGIIQK